MTDHQRVLLNANDKTLADQAAEVRQLKNAMQIRNETNNVLRNQMEEMNDNNFVLSKTEMNHFRKMEQENEQFQARIKDLVKSVELHMDLLQRAEAESAAMRSKADDAIQQLAEIRRKSDEKTQLSETDATTLKYLKKEIVKLRNENKDLSQKLDVAQAELHGLQSLRGGAAGAGMNGFKGDHEQIFDGVNNPKKPMSSSAAAALEHEKTSRHAAEEAARALRNRLSFLLEQMEQASQLAATWQEQKAILKAEIGSLLRANHDLRERLLSVQRNFMGHTLQETGVGGRVGSSAGGPHAFLTQAVDEYQQQQAAERLTEGLLALDQLGDSLQGPYLQPVPNTAEALVERRLFDAICAFSLGSRVDEQGDISPGKRGTKRNPIKLKGIFKVADLKSGMVDIYVDDGDIDAGELLASLQIPAFLKFAQSRPAEKLPKLFTEKMVNILNFSRRTVHDFLEQLGDARIQLGKLQSKVSVSWERVARIRERCARERISKQKAVMRYVREQLRVSDIRKLLGDIGGRAAEHLDDMTKFERGGLLGLRDQAMKDTMGDLVQVTVQLGGVADGTVDGAPDSSSLTVGSLNCAIELRLADCQLDDETVHGIIGLVCGVLAPAAQDLGGNNDSKYEGKKRMVEDDDNEDIDQSKAGNVLMASLGLKVSGKLLLLRNYFLFCFAFFTSLFTPQYFGAAKQVAASNSLARSIMNVRCDYTERIILMNLRGNSLTDLSCKVLGALVEKSTTLRMLDLRENLLSTTGITDFYSNL